MSPASSPHPQWLQQQHDRSSPVLSLCLVLILPVLMLVASSCYRAAFSKRANTTTTPPSPPRLPLIGNLHQIGSLPHRSLGALSRRHGPLMLVQLGQIPTLVVSSADMAREVMKTHDLAFAGRPPFKNAEALVYCSKNVSFAPHGEYWRRAKKTCVVHLLSPKRVQSFRSAREEEVALMIERVSSSAAAAGGGGAAVDLSEILYAFANGLIGRVASGGNSSRGENRHSSERYRELLDETTALLGGFRVDEVFPSLAWLGAFTGMDAKVGRLFRKWEAFLGRIVEEHECRRAADQDGKKKKKKAASDDDDFVDVLLSLQKDPDMDFVLPKDNIKAIVMDVVAAGTDTSYVVLEWAMAELVRNPGVMERAQEEVRNIAGGGKPMATEDDTRQMNYLRAVIKEVLRLHPPAPLLLPHESTEDVQLQGYEIPKKTRVLINAWAIARDPESWDAPEEFKPERFLLESPVDFWGQHFQFIPFGAGRRSCPGINFAIDAVELALANLLYRFDWAPPDGMSGDLLDMAEAPGITICRKLRLQLAATPRH